MPYVDLNTLHNPATGTVAPASWGDQIRDNFEFLIDPPACSVFNTAVSVASGATLAALAAGSENYDNNAMHSTVTNNSRITIQTAGRYYIWTRCEWAGPVAASAGAREIRIHQNGSLLAPIYTGPPAPSGVDTRVVAGITVVAAVADYFEILLHQTQGANLSVAMKEFVALHMTR